MKTIFCTRLLGCHGAALKKWIELKWCKWD
jgi:hypothetical protein